MGANIVKRFITSIVVLSIVGIITFLLPKWTFCILVSVFVGIAMHEFFTIVERKNIFVYKYFGIILGCTIPITTYLNLGKGYANVEPFIIVMACLFTFVLQFIRREKPDNHLTNIAITLFPLFYISWFLTFFIKIMHLSDGAKLVAFVIIVTKATDVGAYFIGKKFGKSPLIPRISPRKTKAGAVGGLLASVLAAFLCGLFLVDIPIVHTIILGIIIGIIGQVGDLAESLLKRDFNIKDSGNELPGLGGVLDVVDSLLFTVPIFYFYLKLALFIT
jgi:phosphatidate cytidylyltransferase